MSYLRRDVSAKARVNRGAAGERAQRCREGKQGHLFVCGAAFSLCLGRALPLEQCRVPRGISLGSPSAGQPCPERQANTGALRERAPRLCLCKDRIYTRAELQDVLRAGKRSRHGHRVCAFP